MDEWFEIILFIVVIIANIIGGIVKIKQKRAKNMPENGNAGEYDDKYFADEEFDIPQIVNDSVQKIPTSFTVQDTAAFNRSHEETAKTSAVAEIQVEESEDVENESFDYREFMRSHGKEAFILAEIVLPANSRQG